MKKIKVVIVEDYELVRDGLSLLLSSSNNIQLIAEVASPKELFDQLKREIPDVILMDIGLPQMSGIELTKIVLAEHKSIKVLFLTANPNSSVAEHCLMAGGKGFLSKECSKNKLIVAIHTVNQNKYYLGESISQDILNRYIAQLNNTKSSKLSEREIEIIRHFANGLSYSEIGQKLNISKKTVETHRKNIFNKLSLKNNTELIKYAIKQHIIEL